jgi:hypothetical protein
MLFDVDGLPHHLPDGIICSKSLSILGLGSCLKEFRELLPFPNFLFDPRPKCCHIASYLALGLRFEFMKRLLLLLICAGLLFGNVGRAFADGGEGRSSDRGDSSDSGRDDGGGGEIGNDDSDDEGGGGGDSSGSGGSISGEQSGGSGATGNASSPNSGKSSNQDQVRRAVASGQAVSLPLLLTFLTNNYPGQLLDVKLRSSIFGMYYDVKYIDPSNHLLSLALDARTLKKR